MVEQPTFSPETINLANQLVEKLSESKITPKTIEKLYQTLIDQENIYGVEILQLNGHVGPAGIYFTKVDGSELHLHFNGAILHYESPFKPQRHKEFIDYPLTIEDFLKSYLTKLEQSLR